MFRTITAAFAALTFSMAAQGAIAETLTVGAYSTNPPWEFKNESSEFDGFEVDLVKAIGKKLGMDVEFVDLGFQELFAATSSGRIDMAISTITITDERLQNQSFTQGYFDSDLALISKADGVDSLAAMKGQPVGVLSSSVAEAWTKANAEAQGFGEIRGYKEQQSLLLDVRAGRIAGAIGDLAGYQFAFAKMPDLKILDRISTGDRFAIMLSKGSAYLEPVNNAISELKNDGTLAALHEKWLGVQAEDGTSTVTVLDIPQAQ